MRLLSNNKLAASVQSGALVKLIGSTSNVNRKGGGTAYYCIWGSNVNIRCILVDAQVAAYMHQVQVDPEQIPMLRQAYTAEMAEKLGHRRCIQQRQLAEAHKAVDEEEARASRLYAAGKITEHVWDSLWQEWQDKRRTIQSSLEAVNHADEAQIVDLDTALTILGQIGPRYTELEAESQYAVLREIVERVVRFARQNDRNFSPDFQTIQKSTIRMAGTESLCE